MSKQTIIRNFNRPSTIIVSILISLSGWILWTVRDFPVLPEGYPGPDLFPRILAISLLLTTSCLLFTEIRKSNKSEERKKPLKECIFKLIAGLMVISLFPIISPLMGFLTALFLCGFAMGLLLSIRWWVAGVLSASCSLGVYLIFSNLLGVVL